jgi:hypothetical protein
MFSTKNMIFYTNFLDNFPHSNGYDKSKTHSKMAFFDGKEGFVFDYPFTAEDIIDVMCAIEMNDEVASSNESNADKVINALKNKFFPMLMKLDGKFCIIVDGDLKTYPYEVIQANVDHGMKFTLHEAISAFVEEYLNLPVLVPSDNVPSANISGDNVAISASSIITKYNVAINTSKKDDYTDDNIPSINTQQNKSPVLELDVAKVIFHSGNDCVGLYVANKYYNIKWPFTPENTMSEVKEHINCNPDTIITRIMRKHYKKLSIDETTIKLIAIDNREYWFKYSKFQYAYTCHSKTPNWLILMITQINKAKQDDAFALEKEKLESSHDKVINCKNALEDELVLVKNKLADVKDELALAKTELFNDIQAQRNTPFLLIAKIIASKIPDVEKLEVLDYFKTDEGYLFNWLVKNTKKEDTFGLLSELFNRRFKLVSSEKWEFSIDEVNTYSNNVLFELYCDEIKTIHIFGTDLKKGLILREFIDYVEATQFDNKESIKKLMTNIMENRVITTDHKLVVIHILDKIAF